jgi:transcriptional regulator with XRE-family HTH domain
MTIYVRLRELRLALGLTQAQLASRARVRRATVSRLENARITSIDLEVLEKLADALGVEPGFLLTQTPVWTARRWPEQRASQRWRGGSRIRGPR